LPERTKVAIVAALEREIKPLVRSWRVVEREHGGRSFRFYESDRAVLVCGGMGPAAARRATEAVIALYEPASVLSAGFAGALDSSLKVGAILVPGRVLDARDGSSTETGIGQGVLVSFSSIAGPEQKAKLAKAYGAQAADMEAAAVAMGAQARGVPFTAVKAISDESSFDMPSLDRFVDGQGQFCATKFVAFAAAQPWLWPKVWQMARNSSRAANALCQHLSEFGLVKDSRKSREADLRPIGNASK
jgi:adenosylhomocysteine nucleosidase